jgi:hypothetical protein
MKLFCWLGFHQWRGCKCELCRAGRDELHEWSGCKCGKCGKRRDEQHTWAGCRCKTCGATRDQDHQWNTCYCVGCGKQLLPHVLEFRHHYEPSRSARFGYDAYACTLCGWGVDHVPGGWSGDGVWVNREAPPATGPWKRKAAEANYPHLAALAAAAQLKAAKADFIRIILH